jgi:hypothetical protein
VCSSDLFAKDVYSSNEDSMLTIYKGHFQFMNIPELNPYGTVYEHASMGIDYFYYLDTHFGTESKVEFIFERTQRKLFQWLILRLLL